MIFEGGNSRIKGLIPSFVTKPASLGFLINCERWGGVDEIGKQVEFESSKHESNNSKNILGELNFILDNKLRRVGSGNDNTCSVQATAKFTFATNPVSGLQTIGHHVGLIDPTTMSRIFWWVQDEAEQAFVMGPKGVIRVPPTLAQAYTPLSEEKKEGKTNIKLVEVGKTLIENEKKYVLLGRGWGRVGSREEFLTLFDTCQSFLCGMNDVKVDELVSLITQLAREPMKGIWKPRGQHHVKLLVDGLIKHRCLFKDYDASFLAKQEDYDMAERILIRMVKSWDTDLSPKEDIS